jgi:hypothetical protein
LLTYCDHCGDGLRGEMDHASYMVVLKCPRTGEMKQSLPIADVDEWPEWVREKLDRMMRD